MPHHPDELIPTRASLLTRLKDWQNQSSWQDFFDTYWKLVYGVARKGGLNDAEAQDVAKVKPRLDPEKYQIFDFYVNKDWPPEKVAERFRVSVDQVYLTKHRVTEAIRSEVERLEQETI